LYNTVFAEGEEIISALVPDKPGLLWRHKNQVAVVTNLRLIYVADAAITAMQEIPYTTGSVNIHQLRSVRHTTRTASAAMLLGIVLLVVGIGIAFGGITKRLTAYDALKGTLVTLFAGCELIFGTKRRVLIFDTNAGVFEWVSDPLRYRATQSLAESTCAYFGVPQEAVSNSIPMSYSHLVEPPRGAVIDNFPVPDPLPLKLDEVLVPHLLVTLAMPYVALFWGIINYRNGKKKSGRFMLIGCLIWAVFLVLLFAAIMHYGQK